MCRTLLAFLALAAPAAADPAPRADNKDLVDFVDNEETYKEKTLTFEAVYRNQTPLRETLGGGADYLVKDPEGRASVCLMIYTPAGLKVPNAHDGDLLVVTFQCKKGKLRDGNVATSIKRK